MASVIDAITTKPQPRTTSREESTGCCSRLFVSWFTSIIFEGRAKILTDTDLGPLKTGDDSVTNYKVLMKLWNKEVTEKGTEKANLFNVWVQFVGRFTFAKMLLWAIVDFLCQVATPLMSRLIIQHVEKAIVLSMTEMILLTIGLSLAPVTAGFCRGQMTLLAQRKSLHIYSALTTAVYRKTMRLSAQGRASVETGQVINMLSSDASNAMERAVLSIVPLLVAPPVVIIVLILLHGVIGNSMFAGFGFLLFSLPMNFNIFRHIVKYYKLIVGRADNRVKLFNELITGIRIVKYYSWEVPFKSLIDAARKSELAAISKHAVWMQCGMMVVFMQMSNLMQLTTFTTFSLTGGMFSASNIFTAMQLFGVLRGPVSQFPSSLSQLASLLVATKRLGNYFKRDEVSVAKGDMFTHEKAQKGEAAVKIANGVFEWSKSSQTVDTDSDKTTETDATDNTKQKEEKKEDNEQSSASSSSSPAATSFSLNSVNLDIQPGELVMVVGLVGCGKSSLLSALLNDMPKSAGTIAVRGKTSIVQQNAWITNNTLRSNVVFGETFDRDRYNDVIAACSLTQDLKQFQGGDQIVIGERGINLSGGQKTRVGLARACYSRSDIVCLDCPLAAVDSHVADHIFNECIMKFLSERTRIFATNQIQRLEHADKIVVLRNGAVVACGSWEEIQRDHSKELELLGRQEDKTNEADQALQNEQQTELQMEMEVAQLEGDNAGVRTSTLRLRSNSTGSVSSSHGDLRTQSVESLQNKQAAQLMEKEEREIGHVSADVWKYFFASGGWCFSFCAIACLTFFTYVQVGVSFTLSEWCNEVSRRPLLNTTVYCNSTCSVLKEQHATSDRTWLGFYGGAMLFALLVMLLGGYLMAMLRVRVAKKLHNDMLVRILHAPISFFDVTPAGRILNRFSKEQSSVDSMLTVMIGFFFVTLNTAFAAMIAITIASYGILAIVFVPLVIGFYYVSSWVRHASIEIQRLEAVHRSPLYAASTEILGGVNTIRAFGQVERFETTYNQHLDRQMVPFFFVRSVLFAWMTIRINAVTSFIVLCTLIAVLLFPDLFPPGNVALCLTWGLSVTEMLLHIVNLSIEAEIQMNAVERIKNYAQDLPQEKPMVIQDTAPSNSWPEKGSITFTNIRA